MEGGRQGSGEKKEDAEDGSGSVLVGPGKKTGRYTRKEAVTYSLMFLLILLLLLLRFALYNKF